MTLRVIGHDEHYGNIGFGSMTMSGANTFSSAPMDTICEPDIVIKTGTGRNRVLEIDIDDILVWDNRHWLPEADYSIDVAGAEAAIQEVFMGVTVDNTRAQTDGPTSDAIATGTRTGGSGASITGAATANNTTRTQGQEVPGFVARWDFGSFANEENATGEININNMAQHPKHGLTENPRYRVDGNDAHYLMTGAHYWMWGDTAAIGAAAVYNLGASVRRVSIDIEELMFDRAVLFTILDALVATN